MAAGIVSVSQEKLQNHYQTVSHVGIHRRNVYLFVHRSAKRWKAGFTGFDSCLPLCASKCFFSINYFLLQKLKWVVSKLFFVHQKVQNFLNHIFIYMIFYIKNFYLSSEFSLIAKWFYKVIPIHHPKLFKSEMFLRESGSLPNAPVILDTY